MTFCTSCMPSGCEPCRQARRPCLAKQVAPLLEQLVGRALEEAQSEAEDELRLAAVRQRRRAAEEVRCPRAGAAMPEKQHWAL